MGKGQKPQKPDRDDGDLEEDPVVPDGPPPWNIEIEFVDRNKKSEMRSCHGLVFDAEHLQVQTEDGKLIAFPFALVHKVLVMHSTRFDAYVINRNKGSQEG